MDKQYRDLSYFRIRLQELVEASFPELAANEQFLGRRAQEAAEAYEEAFRCGNAIETCEQIAQVILFDGLHFSRFDTIMQILSSEFDTLMADEDFRPFALKMMPVCEDVFAKYALADDYAYRVEYDLLYTELTGIIQIYIDEHGLQ